MTKTTKKVNFNIDEALLQEIDIYAAAAGVNRTAFLSMSVAIGARAIARQLMPERFVTPDMLQKMREAGYAMPEDTPEANEAEQERGKSS